jgi:regulator of chromosome condensation
MPAKRRTPVSGAAAPAKKARTSTKAAAKKATAKKVTTKKAAAVKKATAKKAPVKKSARAPAAPKPETQTEKAHKERLDAFKKLPSGDMLSFGSGDMSQLGLGSEGNMIERKFPTLLQAVGGVQFVDLAAGSLHNAAVSQAGEVYTWGCNDDKALGRGGDEWLPAKVGGALEGVEVCKVCCGASHTVALAVDGTVFSWGTYRNNSGILGHTADEDMTASPVMVHGLKEVVDIASGDSTCFAVDRSGHVYQWGDIGNGQRTNARISGTRLVPRRVTLRKPKTGAKPCIVKVFAGGYSCFALAAVPIPTHHHHPPPFVFHRHHAHRTDACSAGAPTTTGR